MLGDGTEVVNSSDDVDDSDEPFEKPEEDAEALSKPAAKPVKSENEDSEMKDATPTAESASTDSKTETVAKTAETDTKPSSDPPTKQEDKEV